MLIVSVLIGVFIVIIGFLVKKYPNLIAGYNTMSEREKRKVDIEGLSTMMRNSFFIIGTLVALSYPLFTLFVLKEYIIWAIFSIIAFGVFIILIIAQTYKKRN